MATALPPGACRPSPKGCSEDKMDPREVRLHRLVDITYEKIEELRGLLAQESNILGVDVQDPTINPIFERQKRLMNQAVQVFSTSPRMPPQQLPRRIMEQRVDARPPPSVRKHSVSFKMDMVEDVSSPKFVVPPGRTPTDRRGYRHDHVPVSPRDDHSHRRGMEFTERSHNSGSAMLDSPVQRECFKMDPSWYGSLDRNYAKKKSRPTIIDKRRRQTNTVGSMAGLDYIKKSQELQPDERYEIGLPKVPNLPSSKLSTTIHATLSYPQLPSGWGHSHDFVDGQRHQPTRSYVDQDMGNRTPHHSHSRQQSVIADMGVANLSGRHSMKDSGRGRFHLLGGGDSVRDSSMSFASPSKSWFETNVDESISVSELSPVMSSAMTMDSSSGSGVSLMDGMEGSFCRLQLSGTANDSHEVNSKSSESNESYSGFGNESTKPFEMSDYYKYSTKYRTQKQDGYKDDSSKGAGSISKRVREPSVHNEPLSAEKKKSLIEFFSTPGNPWTDDNESWFSYDDDVEKDRSTDLSGNHINATLAGAGKQSTPEGKGVHFVESIPRSGGHSWSNGHNSWFADGDKLNVSKVLHHTSNTKTTAGEQNSEENKNLIPMFSSPAPIASENHDLWLAYGGQGPLKAPIASASPSDKKIHLSYNKNEREEHLRIEDINGNPSVGPKLPPRLPRDSKLQTSNHLYQDRSQHPNTHVDCTDENTAWVMDTPTFV